MEAQLSLLRALNAWTITGGAAGLLFILLSLRRREEDPSDLEKAFAWAVFAAFVWMVEYWLRQGLFLGVALGDSSSMLGSLTGVLACGLFLKSGSLLASHAGRPLSSQGWAAFCFLCSVALLTLLWSAMTDRGRVRDAFALVTAVPQGLGLFSLGVGLGRAVPASGFAPLQRAGMIAAILYGVVLVATELWQGFAGAPPLATYSQLLLLLALKVPILVGLGAVGLLVADRRRTGGMMRELEALSQPGGPLERVIKADQPDVPQAAWQQLWAQVRGVFSPRRTALVRIDGDSVELLRGDGEWEQTDTEPDRPPPTAFAIQARAGEHCELVVEADPADPLAKVIEESLESRISQHLAEADRDLQFRTLHHEIVTPLSTILFGATNLLDDPELTAEKLSVTLQDVEGEASRTLELLRRWRLIFQFLLRDEPLPREPVDVSALAAGVQRQLAPLATKLGRTLQLRTSKSLFVSASPSLLKQAVVNLVMNAVRHGGGAIRLGVDRAPEPPGRVRLEVADHGPGLGAPLADVLKPFARAAHLPPLDSGVGLGLYLTHMIIKRHDSELKHRETAPGSQNPGATFTVDLEEVSR